MSVRAAREQFERKYNFTAILKINNFYASYFACLKQLISSPVITKFTKINFQKF